MSAGDGGAPAPSFRAELEAIINKHSRENGSNTPDFIIAAFLCDVLRAWDVAVTAREHWYGRGGMIQAPPDSARERGR